MLTDEGTQLHSLTPLHDSDDNCFGLMLIGSLGMINCSTAVQGVDNIIADGLRVVTDNGKIFSEVDIFDNTVNNQRFRQKSTKGEESRLGIKDKAGCQNDAYVHQKQGGTDIQFCVLF